MYLYPYICLSLFSLSISLYLLCPLSLSLPCLSLPLLSLSLYLPPCSLSLPPLSLPPVSLSLSISIPIHVYTHVYNIYRAAEGGLNQGWDRGPGP